MKFLELIRYKSFWFADYIKGSHVSKHYKQISNLQENPFSISSKQIQKKNLENLLTHAILTTKFYSKYKRQNALKDFQVINKNIIQKNIQDFKSKKFSEKNLYKISTSGSTGISFKLYHDKNKRNRNSADTIYFSKQVGFKIGYKLLYLRHWNKYYKKSKILSWVQNIYPIEVLSLNEAYISNLIDKIEHDKSNKIWIGFPSAFEQICKYLDKIRSKPIQGNLKGVVAMAEGLNEYTKESMERYFNTSIVSRYSNMENGIIAQQKINGNGDFIINKASYILEVLKLDEDEPANTGEAGRIIITDLFNYSMPLIRYDTGDIGTIDCSDNLSVLKEINGRKTDVLFDTKGNVISSFIMANIINYKGIKQSQLVQQEEKIYDLILNITANFDKQDQIIKEFKSYLGTDAIINIKYTNNIPLLNSGKRKVTINNYKKKH